MLLVKGLMVQFWIFWLWSIISPATQLQEPPSQDDQAMCS